MTRAQQLRNWALLGPALLFLCAVFLLPILGILGRSVLDPDPTLRHYAALADNRPVQAILWNTFRIALIVTLITALLGYLVAWAMSRARGWQASVMLACLLLPLWTSDLVRTFAWTILLGRRGPVNEALLAMGLTGRPVAFLFNETAVLIGSVHILLPFMVLPLYAAMRAVDPRLMRAAQSLGASPLAAFRDVFLPLTLPGLLAGAILVYVLAVGLYITPAALGSPRETMIAQVIEQQGRRLLNWGTATAIATVLLVAVTASLMIAHRFARLTGALGAQGGR